MKTNKQLKITESDLKEIYGEDYEKFFLRKVIPNSPCAKCNSPYNSTITRYEIFLNDLNDVILKGFCAECGSPVNRYLETGEVEKYQTKIEEIRKRKIN